MTEDMLWEQATVLARLGTSEEAARVRAKMQSSSLLSDMQAFKVSDDLYLVGKGSLTRLPFQAANPGCLLEDFVRWYSPRDWIEEDPNEESDSCLLYTSPSPRDATLSRMPSSA